LYSKYPSSSSHPNIYEQQTISIIDQQRRTQSCQNIFDIEYLNNPNCYDTCTNKYTFTPRFQQQQQQQQPNQPAMSIGEARRDGTCVFVGNFDPYTKQREIEKNV